MNETPSKTYKFVALSEPEKRERKARGRASASVFLLSLNVLFLAVVLGYISPVFTVLLALPAIPAAVVSFVAYLSFGGSPITSGYTMKKVPVAESPEVHRVSDKMLSESEFSEKMSAAMRDLDKRKVLAREKAALREAVEEARRARPQAASSLSEYNRFNQELKEIEASTEERLAQIDIELEAAKNRLETLPDNLVEEGFPVGTWVRWGSEGFAVGTGNDGRYVLYETPWNEVAQETTVENRPPAALSVSEAAPFLHTAEMGLVLRVWTAATVIPLLILFFAVG